MLTPNEAATIWCPSTTASSQWKGTRLEWTNNRGRGDVTLVLPEQSPPPEAEAPRPSFCCISRYCMAWRWENTDNTGDDDNGWCSLYGDAGRFPPTVEGDRASVDPDIALIDGRLYTLSAPPFQLSVQDAEHHISFVVGAANVAIHEIRVDTKEETPDLEVRVYTGGTFSGGTLVPQASLNGLLAAGDPYTEVKTDVTIDAPGTERTTFYVGQNAGTGTPGKVLAISQAQSTGYMTIRNAFSGALNVLFSMTYSSIPS